MFDDLVKLLNKTGDEERRKTFFAALDAFEVAMQKQNEIRLFVDGTGGLGHQASSVHVMFRLIEKFAYQKKILIVYKEGDAKNGFTVNKLALLIAGFDPEHPEATIDVLGASVTALPWTQRGSLKDVTLGFTGGADGKDNLAAEIKVGIFLRLQPYFWPSLQRIELANGTTVDLDEEFGETFYRRAYYFEPPGVLPEEWEWYEKNGPAEQQEHVKLAHALVDNIGTLHLCPVYGVREATETGQLPDETLSQIAVSIQLANFGSNPYKGPAVVVSLDNDVSESSYVALQRIYDGGLSNNEIRLKQEMELKKAAVDDPMLMEIEDDDFITWVEGLLRNAAVRATTLTELNIAPHMFIWRGISVNELKTNLANLKKEITGVAVFQLGKLPKIVFEKIYSIATLPTVFEGQGTANLALSIGNPYLHLPRPKVQDNNYPDTTLQLPNASEAAQRLAVISKAVTSGFTATTDSFYKSATTVSDFIKGVYTGTATKDVAYFKAIREFYSVESNDKLLVAIVFLAYCMKLVKKQQLALLAAGGATPANLDELWVALNDNLTGSTLNFIPGTLSDDNIASFYRQIALGGVTIDGVTLTNEKDAAQKIIRINVTGGKTSAFGFPMLAELEFTSPRGAIVCRGRYTSSEPWDLIGVPWIVLVDGGFELTIYDTDYPASGSIFATVRDAGLTVTLEYPTPEDAWRIQFRTEKPVGVETMFNIAGGVNLLRALPPPVLALGGFGATGFDLLFRPTQARLESVQVYLGTAQPWPIVEGRLEVTRIAVSVAVIRPTDRTRKTIVQIEGDVTIGTALIRVGAAIPDLQFRGELVAGVLTLESILAVFLPGVPLDLSAVPDITQFLFVYNSLTGDYSVSCNLNVGWTVTVPGVAPIELRDLAFSVEKLSAGATGGITAYFVVGDSTEESPLTISMSAIYLGSITGWQFAGRQESGIISLGKLVSRFLPSGWELGADYNIRDVAFTIAPTPSKYTFFGATDGFWVVPFIPDLRIAGDLALNYSGGAVGVFSGRLNARIQYYFIDIQVYYAFGPKAEWGFTWGILSGVVARNAKLEWVGTLKLGTFSLGSMVETMVSWATGSTYSLAAPWSFLNSITFTGIELTFNFTTNQVSLSLALNIDAGFASLTKIKITYDPTNQTGMGGGANPPVAIELEGRFFWQVGEEQKPLGWDATRPETTPAPPGNGNQYLDLRLLALGQHVTAPGLTSAPTVQKAIERIASMKDPEPGKIPDVTFDPDSAWFVGADFGVLRFGDGGTP